MKIKELIVRLLEFDMDAYVYVADGDSLKHVSWKLISRGTIHDPALGYPYKKDFTQARYSDDDYNAIILSWD